MYQIRIQMKTKYIILFILCILPIINFAQNLNQKIIEPKKQEEILIGLCDETGLKTVGEFGIMFPLEYNYYKPAEQYMSVLKDKLSGYKITIVFGTWCGDSKEQMPRFFKILDMAGYDNTALKLIAVDRDRKAGSMDIADLKIEKVPTIILYKDGKEVGRIIETPKSSLEQDLTEMMP